VKTLILMQLGLEILSGFELS